MSDCAALWVGEEGMFGVEVEIIGGVTGHCPEAYLLDRGEWVTLI